MQDTLMINLEPQRNYRILNDSPRVDQTIILNLQENAQCEWIHLLKNATQISYVINVASGSELCHSMIMTSVKKTNISVDLTLAGKKSTASLYGFYGLQADDSLNITTNQHHECADTTSNLLYKGLLADSAQATFNGMITIDQDAGKSCAAQYNKNLLLSNNARAVSVPSLQVLTNDVSCKHGSAIGKWDEQQLWYLLSRGLSMQQAQQLLIHAFLADIFHGITDHELKDTMSLEIANLFFPQLP
jgi:Fe-S cluster assembly protein SufD